MGDFKKGQAVSRRYRNRRIGEFLKELGLAEGRSTGIPKILRAMAGKRLAGLRCSKAIRTARRFLSGCRCMKRLVRRRPGQVAVQDTGQVTVQDAVHDAVHDTMQDTGQDTVQDTVQDTDQVTGQVTDQVNQLLAVLSGEMGRNELQAALKLLNRSHFTTAYLKPALAAGLIEMTLPDKPTSRNQRYRRTAAGQALADRTKGKGSSA